jgi:hypothetical protein
VLAVGSLVSRTAEGLEGQPILDPAAMSSKYYSCSTWLLYGTSRGLTVLSCNKEETPGTSTGTACTYYYSVRTVGHMVGQ